MRGKNISLADRRARATKNYRNGRVDADVFCDSPSNRERLALCTKRLLELIAADPDRPGRKDAA